MTAGTQQSTVIVVTWRGRNQLTACLDALARQSRPHRILVVDNASTDGTARLIAEHPSRPAVLRTQRNLGYAGALARVLPTVRTRYVAWLNDDAVPSTDWLARLEDALDEHPCLAATSSLLRRPDGAVQSAGVRLTADGHGADATQAPPDGDVFGFCGGAVLLRTAALADVPGVAGEFFCYYEDTDLSWQLRLAGWAIRAVPAEVVHAHGSTTAIGSRQFHRWNERNRLLTLLRCAPAGVAVTQLVRFIAVTALLPIKRVPPAANFSARLRLRVLAEVFGGLGRALRTRRRIGYRARQRRAEVWATWAGRAVPGRTLE
ncbi:GT2 family glycosyltransferase [Tamaricihabitans halophyticus]|uniref:GT2 family glycosyltransferase n=1 Tax=Tamaricihabitans halophyticus TaxID=1262583 RepID=A0A4R2QQF1_9PSEU|nr:glycosyltransferase family 2 protein [Tamaricihabitans halophyticus]TCP49255.1 GT2 family glycosyltransferase [Tamaricihabitans halophyticus]